MRNALLLLEGVSWNVDLIVMLVGRGGTSLCAHVLTRTTST
jgi:hypothetical protein